MHRITFLLFRSNKKNKKNKKEREARLVRAPAYSFIHSFRLKTNSLSLSLSLSSAAAIIIFSLSRPVFLGTASFSAPPAGVRWLRLKDWDEQGQSCKFTGLQLRFSRVCLKPSESKVKPSRSRFW